jgi:DNA repair photolyase
VKIYEARQKEINKGDVLGLMRVLREFDPWRGELCTCPKKFSFSPYTGCGHSCLYCYISAYIRDPFNPREKKDVLRFLSMDLREIKPGSIVAMSTSSDPYTPPEKERGITRRAIEIIRGAGMRLLVMTKSDLVVRDSDLLEGAAVSFTITTLDEKIASVLEPRAPPPLKRIDAMKRLSERVNLILRLDPIIPGLNDDFEDLLELAKEAGVSHVVSSTYKARQDSLKRMEEAFPWLKLHKLYSEGTRISGYLYLPYRIRRNLMERVRRKVLSLGMTFATCREGMPEIHSPGVSCDGSHLSSAIRKFFV